MSWSCSIKVLAIFTKQKTSAQSWRHTPYLFHQITNQHQHYKKHPKSKLKHLGEYCIWINGEWVGIMTNAASSHQGAICLFCFVCLSVCFLALRSRACKTLSYAIPNDILNSCGVLLSALPWPNAALRSKLATMYRQCTMAANGVRASESLTLHLCSVDLTVITHTLAIVCPQDCKCTRSVPFWTGHCNSQILVHGLMGLFIVCTLQNLASSIRSSGSFVHTLLWLLWTQTYFFCPILFYTCYIQ